MLDYKIDTSDLERFARRLNSAAPFVMDELRTGVVEATTATRDAIRSFTPVDEGLTRDSVSTRYERIGSDQFEGSIVSLPPGGGRPDNLFQMLNDGTRPHKILPRKGKALKFGPRPTFAKSVNHPGTRPYRQVEKGVAASADARTRAYRNTLRRITYRLRGSRS